MELAALEERLGYRFTNAALLEQAVTHRSHGAVHNERLEFLGDAVLNCTIAQLLYQKYARLNEGDLSRLRANLVKQSSLADIAEKLGLSEFLRLGEGEMKSGGFRRPSILADTMEAAFGAVFVDGGFDEPHPDPEQEIGKLLRSLELFPERCHLVGAYALGKAQRLIALLRRAGWARPTCRPSKR